MQYLLFDNMDCYADEILSMLEKADSEFVPPLSARVTTTQSGFEKNLNSEGVYNYFESLKSQKFMFAAHNDNLLGFVSFKENYTCDEIDESEKPDIYISTLVVKPESRGMGITKSMYKTLFEAYKDCNVFTRTWSTNNAHIKILSSFGFETFKVIRNHRGEGIDTVYFKKSNL